MDGAIRLNLLVITISTITGADVVHQRLITIPGGVGSGAFVTVHIDINRSRIELGLSVFTRRLDLTVQPFPFNRTCVKILFY